MCLELLKRIYPTRPLRLLEIGCGEGKMRFFWQNAAIRSRPLTRRPPESRRRSGWPTFTRWKSAFFQADLRTFRLDEEFDIIYSSGVFHHILPGLRRELMENYLSHTAPGGMHAINVFCGEALHSRPSG